jgi:hypothetical protein
VGGGGLMCNSTVTPGPGNDSDRRQSVTLFAAEVSTSVVSRTFYCFLTHSTRKAADALTL